MAQNSVTVVLFGLVSAVSLNAQDTSSREEEQLRTVKSGRVPEP